MSKVVGRARSSGFRLSAASALLLAITACAEDEPSARPELVIGTGEWQFEPLAPGQRVPLVAGTQGGYHVWVSLRARGLAGERLRMELELSPSGPAPVARSDLELRFEPAPGEEAGWVEHLGWPGQLLEPWCAAAQPLLVQATVSDARANRASAMLEIVPTAPAQGFPRACDAP